MAYAASGQKVTASLINGIFAALLSSGFTQQAYVSGATESTTSSTYGDITTVGPTVTITSTGTVALVYMQVLGRNTTANDTALASVLVTGATSITSATNEAAGLLFNSGGLSTAGNSVMGILHLLTINPGTNTYKVQYRSSVNATQSNFNNRKIIVIAP